ncbi:hypothetical protein [Streptomyces sp. NPDC059063]|uniref:hypothetical protein n=1 Tax=unclassified Streptomyces TaxID=2593676 RepID=UPI0036BA2907
MAPEHPRNTPCLGQNTEELTQQVILSAAQRDCRGTGGPGPAGRSRGVPVGLRGVAAQSAATGVQVESIYHHGEHGIVSLSEQRIQGGVAVAGHH